MRVGFHRYRLLGKTVLLTNDVGDHLFLSQEEYRGYLRGIDPGQSLGSRLEAYGFLRHPSNPDAMTQSKLKTSLLSWTGPRAHICLIKRDGRAMSVDVARQMVDFVFSAPGSRVNLELASWDESQWPCIWFIVQYARRKSEWESRPLQLTLRIAEPDISREKLDFLRSHSVILKAVLLVDGPPKREHLPMFPAEKVLCTVGSMASDPAAWIDLFKNTSTKWIELSPGPNLVNENEVVKFLDFYAQALDRMIGGKRSGGLREEKTAAFLSRMRWNLPGQDVLGELAYGPDGGIYASEAGWALQEKGIPLFRIGSLDKTRYGDLTQSDVVRGCVAASQGENQPLCFQCAYKPYCSLSPASNFLGQKTVWGRTPESSLCSLHMGWLDLVFERLNNKKQCLILRNWKVDFLAVT